jgi:Fasciclin domain
MIDLRGSGVDNGVRPSIRKVSPMKLSRRLALVASAAALSLAGTAAVAPSASATTTGTKSLAAVLTADKSGFDKNKYDYDIVTAAVLAVLGAKPKSAVGVLTKGDVAVTAFIPNDQAFRYLVHSLTGKWVSKEKDVFAAVAGLGIDTVETVLLYHVVPGATVTAKQALKLNGASLTTAQGGTVKVKVTWHWWTPTITLRDKDTNAKNPVVNKVNINKGNKQIAHGINRVLRPVDLPPLAGH